MTTKTMTPREVQLSAPLGFAVVGLGYGASRLDLIRATSGANLVAVVDSDASRAEEVGRRYGVAWANDVKSVVARDDVQVVGIFTPSGMHLDVALAAIEAGKHLVMTKPLEVTLERIDEILDAAAQRSVQVFAEFYLRYEPDHYRAHEAIVQGLLGPPILGDFAFKCFRPQWYFDMDGGWRGTKLLNGGGVMMNQAIHLIDQLLWHLGEVDEVQARIGTFAHEIEVEDTAVAVMKMRSGTVASFVGTTTFATNNDYYERFGGGSKTRVEVNGPKGSISVLNDILSEAIFPGEMPVVQKPASVFEDVVRALADPSYSSPSLVRGTQARQSVEVISAIYRAAETGGRVSVADFAPGRDISAGSGGGAEPQR